MAEKTLVLIKPDGLGLRNYVLQKIDEIGRVVYTHFYPQTPLELLAQHYREHKGTNIFDWNMNYFNQNPLEVLVVEGERVVERMRKLVGFSDPKRAELGTIRSLSKDSLELANIERRPIKNLVHCSGNKEEAEKEIKIWTSQEKV